MHRLRPWFALSTLLLLVTLAEVWGEDSPSESSTADVLKKLPDQPDLLINLKPWELPATADMVELGKRITPALTNGLINNMESRVRLACAMVLGATRDPRALQALLDALEDPDDEVRTKAIEALASIESQATTAPLLALLAKPRVPSYIKDRIVETLGTLGDPASVQPLLQAFFQTWDPNVQKALWSLRRHLKPEELEALIVRPLLSQNAKDVPWAVTSFSTERAGELKYQAAAEPLRQRAEAHPDEQNAIVHSLGLIGDASSLPFLRGLLDQTAEARLLNNVVFALHRLGENVEPFLQQALTDRRAYVRFNAVFVAGDLGSAALADELVTALADQNDYVRSEVAVALGKLKSPLSIAALEQASREENPIVRRDALLSLAGMDYPRFRERVVAELIPSKIASVRERAIQFLMRQNDPQAVGLVLAQLDPEDYNDRELALGLLESFYVLDDPQALAFLLRLGATGSHRHRALVLLARYRSEPVRFILRQWLSQPSGEQDQLLRAMGLLKEATARPEADRWLKDKVVKSQLYAAFLLACLNDKAGADRLLVALEESPPELKQVAAVLLAQLDLVSVEGLLDRLTTLLRHEDVYVRLNAARVLVQRGDPTAFGSLKTELDKRVPFIQDEVLDIVERADQAHAQPVLQQWLQQADPMLQMQLQRLVKKA